MRKFVIDKKGVKNIESLVISKKKLVNPKNLIIIIYYKY